jgi:hypothetical protein
VAGGDTNCIEKFTFASDNNSSGVGILTRSINNTAGQSSTVSGYTSGGQPPSAVIDKFPFASDNNATNVGSLTQARFLPAGQQD